VRRDDEGDLPGEGGLPGGDPSWLADLIVPDDLTELDAEVRALRRERRARARRERWRRLASPRRISAPLVVVALLLVAGFAGLVVLFQPRRPSSSPTPLSSPGVTDAPRGDLLPDVPVRLADGTAKSVRDYRPAVLALAPVGCGCDPALRDAGLAADRHDLTFLLVDRQLPPLPAGLPPPAAVRLAEPTGRLAAAYGAEKAGARVAGGPVLVLVGRDGGVDRVLTRASSRGALDSDLARLGA
jgi:hypothetical protein